MSSADYKFYYLTTKFIPFSGIYLKVNWTAIHLGVTFNPKLTIYPNYPKQKNYQPDTSPLMLTDL